MAFAKIVVEGDMSGFGRVLIDGHDISSNVEAVNIRIRAGKMPRIFIKAFGDVVAKADGSVAIKQENF